ncbi:MAG TPA: NUDIX hydrolase [Candidatus Portnoybacteria bacterium]|nr:NUDIX hydrolase [Candidatus Portnoybacteria bacterium]
MIKLPLSIAISVLIKNNQILLIQRIKGDYVGLWGLPGGKIERDEHLSEAAIREIFEESGIKSDFKSYLGLVSEHLVESNRIIQHFLLHICELEPKTTEILTNQEGELAWFNLDHLQEIKDKIIPSDFLMIEKIVKNQEKNYYNCIIKKEGDNYFLKKFE